MAQTDAQKRYGQERVAKAKRRKDALGKLTKLLEDNDIALEDIGTIEKIRVNEWEVVTKDGDGNPQVTPAKAASIVVSPLWETGPEWPLVEPAAPVIVNVPAGRGPTLLRGWKTALVEPDPQIGFLRRSDGLLLPIHDPRAIDVSEQVADAERPNDWINLGDYLDLAEMSHYRLLPNMIDTTQPAIEYGYRHAAIMRALVSERAWVHEGNHDVRFSNYLIDNAKAAFGLKVAASTPEAWPAISLPALLRFDELGIEYEDGYPATWRYINENVATTHGTFSGPSGKAGQGYLATERVSVIHGHDHKQYTLWKTENTRTHKVERFSHSPGTLARIDGMTPGAGKYHGMRVDGTPKRSWSNWQQGITIVRYVPGDGAVELEPIHIDEGVAIHRGQKFTSKITLDPRRP